MPKIQARDEMLDEVRASEQFEVVPTLKAEELSPDALSVQVLVVYKGAHPRKQVYVRGTVMERVDPDNPQRKLYVPSDQGGSTYDFSRVDLHGRPMGPERITEDGRPYSVCRHISHAVHFMNALGPDKEHEFEVRALPHDRSKIQRFQERMRLRASRNIDAGAAVLRDMEWS